MTFKAIAWGIAHLLEKSFTLIEHLNNNANYAIITAAVLIALIWLRAQLKYTARARREGTLI